MTTYGVRTVAKQEFRVRIRTGRWRWLLASWVAVIGGFSVLLRLALLKSGNEGPAGLPMFGWLMFFVLGLALLVAPALSAQSINGDRERGTLATVQVTRLTPAEIVLGKLLAAWGTGLVFLLLTLPFVIWAVAEGGVGIGRAALVVATTGLLIGVICAVSQGLSALFARGITATLMSYLLVFALTVGTMITFSLALALTMTEERVETATQGYSGTIQQPHPERVWWMMAPNPFVVLADSAPLPPMKHNEHTGELEPVATGDPLSSAGFAVRSMREPEWFDENPARFREIPPVWPYGLGFNLVLGAGAVWLSIRRLRTPVGQLPRGVRIA